MADIKLDSCVTAVVDRFTQRAETGWNKYGKNLDRQDLNVQEWLQHLQEELMDATLYVEKLKQELNGK
jgi:hypothetical protein